MNSTKGIGLSISAALGLAGALAGRDARAAGFQYNEQSAAAMGRAGAVSATTDDPSALYYNPAGMVDLKGTQVQITASLLAPKLTYNGPGFPSENATGGPVSQSSTGDLAVAPSAFVTRALSDKAFVGFGFYVPYAETLAWANPSQFVGRTLGTQSSFLAYFLTPAIALKLSDQIAVAVSVSLVPATFSLSETLGATDNQEVLFPAGIYGSEGTIRIGSSAFGVGANAGVRLSFDHLRIGLGFRSAVGLDFTGNAHFDIPSSATASIRSRFPDGGVSGQITLPHVFHGGIGWVDGPWSLELNARATLWNAFNEFRINFTSGLPAKATAQPREWKTVPTIALGGQYVIAGDWAIRLGAAYDFNPVPDATLDPTFPDADRVAGTAGVGTKLGPVAVDAAFQAVYLMPRNITGSVTFPVGGAFAGSFIPIFGLSAGMAF